MPVRRYVVDLLTAQFAGAHARGDKPEQHAAARAAADTAYAWLIQRVDWCRIVIEAQSRHRNLVDAGTHEQLDRARILEVDEACPSCLRDALLADEHHTACCPAPAGPAQPDDADWAGVLARSTQYRRSNPATENGAS